jgi:thioredoxin 1
MSNVIHLTTPAFPALKAQDKSVLIDFWAPWCGPCRAQGPILDTVSLEVGDQAIVAKVNVDEEPSLAAQFGVEAIPTLVLMKNGKILNRFVGVQQGPALVAALLGANR